MPGMVENKSGPVSFPVKLSDGRSVRRHQEKVIEKQHRASRGYPSNEIYVSDPDRGVQHMAKLNSEI